MTEPSPPDDGLTEVQRALFGLFVQKVVGPGGQEVRDDRDWSEADEKARYAGEIPFTEDDLSAIYATLANLPGHKAASRGPGDNILLDTRNAFVSGEPGTADLVREMVCETHASSKPTKERESPLEQDPTKRITSILLDPLQATVALPAGIFGLVVGLPLLHHLQPFAEEMSISMTWLLILGVGLWAALNVLGLDQLMERLIWRLRRLRPMKHAQSRLDNALQLTTGVDARLGRGRQIRALPDPSDQKSVKLILSKADACDRLAVWMFLAVPVTALALWDMTWARIVYPFVVLVLAGSLVFSALDHVGRARDFVSAVGQPS